MDQPIRRVFGYQLRDEDGKPMTVGQVCGAGLAGGVVFLTAYFLLAADPGRF